MTVGLSRQNFFLLTVRTKTVAAWNEAKFCIITIIFLYSLFLSATVKLNLKTIVKTRGVEISVLSLTWVRVPLGILGRDKQLGP